MSIGANLLQIMQFAQQERQEKMKANQAKQQLKPKRAVGFGLRNFRCNLDEIDKIIEEGSVSQANKAEGDDGVSNGVSPIKPSEGGSVKPDLVLSEINSSIQL